MKSVLEKLFNKQDKEYKEFQVKLTPSINPKTCIGVRVPELRKIALEIDKDDCLEFLNELPHVYYDENMLHSILLSKMKDYNFCLESVKAFLPYVDNWAVCDTLNPKCFKKHKDELLKEIKKWVKSKDTYTIRFGIDMLMTYYLDKDFKEEYLDIPSKVHSKEYYVNMMIAWFYATALAKQFSATIPYIENKVLDNWTHNKTIQKAIESYRISDNQKEYLRNLKVKEK